MKRTLLCATILAATTLFANRQTNFQDANQPKEPDLFRKDVPVYSTRLEFLYWTVDEGALDYALKMKHAAWGPTPSYAQGNFKTTNFNLDPGFRVGLLYFRAPHFWEMLWQYTYIGCAGSNSTGKPEESAEFLTGTWPQITPNPLSGARSHVQMYYNVFDVIATRVFFPNPHLRMRFAGGATLAWIKQDWKVHYTDSVLLGTSIRNRWKFVGAGLKSGAIMDWYMGNPDLYLTGNVILGALIGDYTNSALQKTNVVPDPSDNPSIPIRDTHLSDTRPAFTFQASLGPSWQKAYKCTRIEAFVGYEVNLWINLQEIYRSTAGGPFTEKQTWLSSSTMALQGITARLVLDY